MSIYSKRFELAAHDSNFTDENKTKINLMMQEYRITQIHSTNSQQYYRSDTLYHNLDMHYE